MASPTRCGAPDAGAPAGTRGRLRRRALAAEAAWRRVAVDTVLDLEHRARLARPSTMRRIAAALGVSIAGVHNPRTA